jgi:hypothetical protein
MNRRCRTADGVLSFGALLALQLVQRGFEHGMAPAVALTLVAMAPGLVLPHRAHPTPCALAGPSARQCSPMKQSNTPVAPVNDQGQLIWINLPVPRAVERLATETPRPLLGAHRSTDDERPCGSNRLEVIPYFHLPPSLRWECGDLTTRTTG